MAAVATSDIGSLDTDTLMLTCTALQRQDITDESPGVIPHSTGDSRADQ